MFFITFEGGEGAGKTTQIQHLSDHLKGQGYDVVLTREPGGSPEAEKIRDLLVRRDGGEWTPIAECMLFFAARNMHLETVIKPALDNGKIVICDRFTDSTRSYQGYGHGMDMNIIDTIDQVATNGFTPDLTFILDIPAGEGLERSEKRLNDINSNEDRFERLDIEFHEKLRQGFLNIAKQEPDRCIVVDARQGIDEIYRKISTNTISRIKSIK